MSDEVKKQVCKECGRELSINHFPLVHGKPCGVCSDCIQFKRKQSYALNKRKKLDEIDSNVKCNPELERFTPRELMNELKARGYSGELRYVEVKTVKF